MGVENWIIQPKKEDRESVDRVFEQAFEIMHQRDTKMIERNLSQEKRFEFDSLTQQLRNKIEFLRNKGASDFDSRMKQLLDSLEYPASQG